jgi:hypothetical protein
MRGYRITRRAFTAETALAMLAGVTITIAGCGDDDDGVGPSPQPGSRAGAVSSSAGHSHTAEVTAAQLTAGSAISVELRGGDHTHTIALSQAELTQIAAGTRVQKESTNVQAHTHVVTFN